MLINEVCKATALTKKAIEYYIVQGLISPAVLENGYRNFSKSDLETLKKISVLRKLGVSTESIKAVLLDKTGTTLQKLSAQKTLRLQQKKAVPELLDQLTGGKSYAKIAVLLETMEQGVTITEKLLEAFPGYYGRFICSHFSRFLNEPITTETQKLAYQEILSFLDGVSTPDFPADLQQYLVESTKHITANNITDMLEKMSATYQNPETFLADHKEMLDDYMAFKRSEAYKNSPAYKIMGLMKDFYCASGYYEVFIPAMKKLSSSYASYFAQMETANEKFLAQYPDAAK